MTAPRVFVSYSHDNQEHKDWVLGLSTRLVNNGVDILLDQWDLTLGGDLPHFMETGLTAADRVLAICTPTYVGKANAGRGGAGYEKMILTAQLMTNITADRIIPVVRGDGVSKTVPTFLASKRYIDFSDKGAFEARYAELLRDIHGEGVSPRPPLGSNPFKIAPTPAIDPRLSFSSDRYVSPGLSGEVTFDFSNNDGCYVVGAGDMAFETKWSSGGSASVHVYRDPPSIRAVALALGATEIEDIVDATVYDTSSRARTPRLGEIVVWQNSSGYYLATKIERVAARSHGAVRDEVIFTYRIAPNKCVSFASTAT